MPIENSVRISLGLAVMASTIYAYTHGHIHNTSLIHAAFATGLGFTLHGVSGLPLKRWFKTAHALFLALHEFPGAENDAGIPPI